MGYGDNRRTPKMRQRKSRAKQIARFKRRASEVRATRQASKAAIPPPDMSSKKNKPKKGKADKA